MWRICIALHSTPRFAVAFVYYNFYMAKIDVIAERQRSLFKRLVGVNFWLYVVENAALVGVTYIANVDNYRKYCFLRDIRHHLVFIPN